MDLKEFENKIAHLRPRPSELDAYLNNVKLLMEKYQIRANVMSDKQTVQAHLTLMKFPRARAQTASASSTKA